jgi:hypothetical protein
MMASIIHILEVSVNTETLEQGSERSDCYWSEKNKGQK